MVGNEESLEIMSLAAPANGGEYVCVVLNDAGIDTSTSTLNVPIEFVAHPQSMNTTVGEQFNLTCLAEAFPYPTLQWQKMNRSSGLFEGIVDEVMNYLVFNPVQHSHFGMYRCIGNNYINGEHFQIISDSALVTVSPEGSIVLTPQNMTFNYTNTAILTCTVEGGPMNMFSWYLNNTKITSGMNNIIISNSFFTSTLTISSVNAPNHGGTYKCEASNEAGSDAIETMLYVSPRFLEEPVEVTKSRNGSIETLVCRAEAFPVPQYQWFDLLEDNIVGLPEPLLEFNPVIFDSESQYQCTIFSNKIIIISRISTLHG